MSSAQYARALARVLEGEGRHIDAAAAYRVALYDLPEDASLYVGLGDSLRALGRRADALDAYVTALDFDPNSADAHFGMGLCEMHPLRRAQAFADAVRRDPNHTSAHLVHGEALLVLGRHDAALEAFRRAQALAPDNLALASRAGEALANAGQLHDAALFLERSIAEHPIGDHSARGLGRLYVVLARVLATLGRHRDAGEAHRAADYLLPDGLESTEPDADFDPPTDRSAAHPLRFEHDYGEPTDPDAELTDPNADASSPPN